MKKNENVVETVKIKDETEEEYSYLKKSTRTPVSEKSEEETKKDALEKKQLDERREKWRSKERSRRSVSGGDVLKAPLWAQKIADEDDLILRFVTDKGGTNQRIIDMQEIGYSILEAPKGVERFPGEQKTRDASPEGSTVSRIVNQETGERGILMAIPREWYEENQKLKEEKIAKTEEGLKRGSGVTNVTGKVEIQTIK